MPSHPPVIMGVQSRYQNAVKLTFATPKELITIQLKLKLVTIQ
jgi:hypothetical protein